MLWGWKYGTQNCLKSPRSLRDSGRAGSLVAADAKRCYPLEQQHERHRPELLIESSASSGTDALGRWLIGWRLQNGGREPFQVLPVWLPHDKFACDQQVLDPPIQLMPNESKLLEFYVACNEAPGSVLDNAFVIPRLLWNEQIWRAFARHRVSIDARGVPHHSCEVISTHPFGFSTRNQSHTAP